MPQINRIRVNNVKYNFGTQFYDDFMMRFSCKNTIYDLANGGGKSVLMLLLMQNLIPNCTLDEKQPVEKLFRTPGGSSVIHSLVEWKLDSCYQTDGYKYMTTGFCARKAKDSGEENSKETAGIEYFNYCIFYREFGDNDIKNLPLVSDGERITYNGLKSYLRDLDKNDFSVMVRIFDRKGDYQNFISGYGLFESHWEIVRGINKTEGHVRTYFENNYRTARKVIEDLLIEEIIRKSYNIRIGINGEDDEMAKTLMDIKDKLVELSQKKEQISLYDKQIAAMDAFGNYIKNFREIMEEKAGLKKKLSDYLLKCRRLIKEKEKELEDLQKKRDEVNDKAETEKYHIAVAKVMDEENNLKSMKSAADECKELMDSLFGELSAKKDRLAKMEACEDYIDYLDAKTKRDEVLVAIENSMRDKGGILDELYSLASLKRIISDRKISILKERLEAAEKLYDEAKNGLEAVLAKKREEDITAAVFDSNALTYEKKLKEAEKQLSKLMISCNIIASTELLEKQSFEKENLDAVRRKYGSDMEKLKEYEEKCAAADKRLAEISVEIRQCGKELEKSERESELYRRTAEKISMLSGVYKETEPQRLINAVYSIYRNQLRQTAEIEAETAGLENYIENLNNGKYAFQGRQYRKVESYLKENYPDDVITGEQWFAGLDRQVKHDIIKRVPFVEYSFVIRGDFERIRNDLRLRSFMNGSYAVPVISENIINSTNPGTDNENVIFAMQDINYLRDEEKLPEIISRASEELENIKSAADKAKDRLAVIEEDYAFVSENAVKTEEMLRKLQEDKISLEEELRRLEKEKYDNTEISKEIREKIKNLKEDIGAAGSTAASINERLLLLSKAMEKKSEADGLLRDVRAFKDEAEISHNKLAGLENSLRIQEGKYNEADAEVEMLKDAIREIEGLWTTVYSSYYKEEIKPYSGSLSEEELDARFMGLKTVAENRAVDVNDKKTLIKTYEAAMDKCIKSIEYRGFTIEDIAGEHEDSMSYSSGRQQMLRLKNEINVISEKHGRLSDEYSSRNAQINRVEGSISHAVSQIEENYGEYRPFECSDIRKFISESESAEGKSREKVKQFDKECSVIKEKLNNYHMLERDLLKITLNAGIELPVDIMYDGNVSEDDISGYEKTEKQFNILTKNEYRRREEFFKERQKLSETLNDLNAHDLSAEVLRSLNVPEMVEDVDDMVKGMDEINQCIALERDNVTAGIEDMEKIRDSFVTKCVQTCVNIRSDLDRLPQLSKITLDNEVISIIGLVIPYVKEEFYKERMSQYINDTVSFAETFKSYEEKLKYIRGRLTWKKLFSVIVTDMNQIRINLYKRERIKSQSRYLKYEEAVGSTGQSQGIYIQFLIAVINYIASINAAGREVSVMGKTIFIDNPFGAAKDVYIWEPIFKMLKTNHVQLIVPARGATPAITGRFDVNYILGQKMTAGMQQTVVVDYESSVSGETLEYTRLSYEQGSLFD